MLVTVLNIRITSFSLTYFMSLVPVYVTAWKVSKYGVISVPYFPAFGLNTERYEVSLRIQPECGKTRTRNNSVFGLFSRSLFSGNIWKLLVFWFFQGYRMRPEAWNWLRGKIGSINVDNYTDGVTFIHRDSVEKHIAAGGLYDWAEKIFSSCSQCSTSIVSVVSLIEESF